MSDIRVIEAHNMQPAQAIEKIESFEAMLKKYAVRARWRGQEAELKGPGVKGSITVDDTEARVEIKLGMLAKAAGIDPVRLSKSISKRLRAAFDEG